MDKVHDITIAVAKFKKIPWQLRKCFYRETNTCDSFSNLFAEKPRRFRLEISWAKKLRPGVIAQKTMMKDDCAKKVDRVIPAIALVEKRDKGDMIPQNLKPGKKWYPQQNIRGYDSHYFWENLALTKRPNVWGQITII